MHDEDKSLLQFCFVFLISDMIGVTLRSSRLDGQYKVSLKRHGGIVDQKPTVKAYFNTILCFNVETHGPSQISTLLSTTFQNKK